MALSYYTRVITALEEADDYLLVRDIMDEIGVPHFKETYVIRAIKKGMDNGTIEQLKNPDEQVNMYKGHYYCLA